MLEWTGQKGSSLCTLLLLCLSCKCLIGQLKARYNQYLTLVVPALGVYDSVEEVLLCTYLMHFSP